MTEIKALIKGGKASPAPPLGPSLAAAKMNTAEVISAINEKTKAFEGMEVPVVIKIDAKTKKFDISVGTPTITALVKKELGVQLLSKAAFNVYTKDEKKEEFKESLKFEQVVKIAKMKMDDIKTDKLKAAVKQVVAYCVSSGVFVEGKKPKEINKEIDEGKWDDKIV
jgi:large subunit ribosomal protein L11